MLPLFSSQLRRSILKPAFANAFTTQRTKHNFHGAFYKSRLYSTKEEIEIGKDKLHESLRKHFMERETDGILLLGPSIINKFNADEVISSALQATNNNKGQAASILNAVIASCSLTNKDQESAATYAWELYTTWEELADELGLNVDMVTFCSTYGALMRYIDVDEIENREFFLDCAQDVLERAQRYTKKIAGSKRRKLLNSISRKSGSTPTMAKDCLDQLQANYGEDFDVLFENDQVLVINKPSGMVCYHTRKTTDGKIGRKKKSTKKKKKGQTDDVIMSDISLEDALIDIGCSLSTLNPDALGIVHRIDRGTSGCLILPKTNDAHARLLTRFFTRQAKKEYRALVRNDSVDAEMDLAPSGVIDDNVGGRPALSYYQFEEAIGKNAYILNVETRTGRKHQVRVHCASLGRPIFLDPLYDTQSENIAVNKVLNTINDGRRFFLHASSLQIQDFNIDVTAPIPLWWKPVMKDLAKL